MLQKTNFFLQNKSDNNNNNDNSNDNNNHDDDNNNNDNFPDTRKYWVDIQRGRVSSHGERNPLHPSTDGVSIKNTGVNAP